LELQIKFATSLPHGAEAALRFWATVNKTVANLVSHVDVERFVGLSNALTSMGIPRRKADIYSKLALNALVGVQVTQKPVDILVLEEMLSELCAQLIS